jgi:hypothetical protein
MNEVKVQTGEMIGYGLAASVLLQREVETR